MRGLIATKADENLGAIKKIETFSTEILEKNGKAHRKYAKFLIAMLFNMLPCDNIFFSTAVARQLWGRPMF